MCGITGFFASAGHGARLGDNLTQAVKTLHHRGPDTNGTWLSADRRVGFGHARLSILDLSEHGRQPMATGDGLHAMVYNGEVYNFRDIRAELEKAGGRFAGSGDAEVVFAALRQWGVKAVEKFIGMFAIAFWDGVAGKLYLIRDRAGVKPLYYLCTGGMAIFGSELKAVRAFDRWKPEIDLISLGEYFQYGYIGDPRSIYKNVRKVPPGHIVEIGSGLETKESVYWSLPESGSMPIKDEAEAASRLEELLISAVDYRMIADVPVGQFLSGGLDSTLVTALLVKAKGHKLKTFTIGFHENELDESGWAKKVAEHLGTEHFEHMLSINDCLGIVPMLPDFYDEPFADSSAIPTYFVSKMAREHVKVALSADGGDELFCGYEHYYSVPRRFRQFESVPAVVRRFAAFAMDSIPEELLVPAAKAASAILGIGPGAKIKTIDRLNKTRDLFKDFSYDSMIRQTLSIWREAEVQLLLPGGKYINPRQSINAISGEIEEKMTVWDYCNYLPGDILTKVDRASMAVSLESREPLLDHRLVEFAFALPMKWKKGGLGSKHLLRKVLYKYVPRGLVDRKKQGFAIPIDKWLNGELKGKVMYYLDPKRLDREGILNPAAVVENTVRYYAGKGVAPHKIWTLLMFEMWIEKWG